VRPYAADGEFSFIGLLTLTLLACVTGVVVGALAGWLSQWFFVVAIFPLLMGAAIGGVGAYGVKASKARLPFLCGAAGLLGGCVAVLAMHEVEYLRFEREMSEIDESVRQVARDFDELQTRREELDPEFRKLLDHLQKEPEIRAALAVDGLLQHLDLKARRGVEIGRSSARAGQKRMNLGYTGSYIYWAVELLLIAGVAYFVMNDAAAKPFCSACESWKAERHLGTFAGSPPATRPALEEGNLTGLVEMAGAGDPITATLFECPQCAAQAPVDVRLEHIIVNKKGETSKKKLCQVTLPGEALVPLEQAFAAAENRRPQPAFESPVDDPEAGPLNRVT
jgi:hypothetical protein